MKRYIDQNKAFCILRDKIPDIIEPYVGEENVKKVARMLLNIFCDIPVEDAGEIVRGKWCEIEDIKEFPKEYVCSNCGHLTVNPYGYCVKCGSKNKRGV